MGTNNDSPSAVCNFIDCTESNDEEEEEEEEGKGKVDEQEEKDQKHEENHEKKTMDKKETIKEGQGRQGEVEEERKETPRWEDFFNPVTLSDSQNSHSQSCCSIISHSSPCRMSGSQTPELFPEMEEESVENLSLTLSASLSNQSSQNQESSSLPENVLLQPEQEDDANDAEERDSGQNNSVKERDLLPSSQESSDFDIPCTPESKVPRPNELLQLYRKLAAGEEVVVRKKRV